MLPSTPSEFERQLALGELDLSIYQILSELHLSDDEKSDGESESESAEGILPAVVSRSKQLARSRLWLAEGLNANRFLQQMERDNTDLLTEFEGSIGSANLEPADTAHRLTVRAEFRGGTRSHVQFGAEFSGIPLDLVLVTAPQLTRLRFEEMISFVAPQIWPDSVQPSYQSSDRVYGTALGQKSLSAESAKKENDGSPPSVPFDVEFDHTRGQLRISTVALDGENGLLIAVLQFEDCSPVPILLERSEGQSGRLTTLIPVPKSTLSSQQGIVVVRDIRTRELNLLSPLQASLWLASQSMIAIPLSEADSTYEFTVNELDRNFIEQHPEALIVARVAPAELEVR